MLKPPSTSPGKTFQTLYEKETLIVPGVFNAITALAADKAGAKALYLTGAGVTNSLLAVPDIALITQTEMSGQASHICQATSLPIIADADTGYGEVFNVQRTVIEMERSGLAGIHLEDQMNPKQCGHLDGKTLITTHDMVKKITAAVNAKKDPHFLIIARTDAKSVEGLSKAIERALAYQEAGADILFPEGLESEEEFEKFREKVSCPLLANMTEFGKTPILPASRFKEMGYEIVIFPMSSFRLMLKAVFEGYVEILNTGTQKNLIEKMFTRSQLYELIEYSAYNELDERWSII